MVTLEEVLECDAYFDSREPMKKFIDNADTKTAWQIVLGSVELLRYNGLEIDQLELEEKAGNIAKSFWDSNLSILAEEYTVKNGKLEGPYKIWDSTGQIVRDCFYKDDELDGLWRSFHPNGQLADEIIFENGTAVQPYKSFHGDGTIRLER